MASEIEKSKREKFLKAVNSELGPTLQDIGIKSDSGDFITVSNTPNFTPYIDHEGNEQQKMTEVDGFDNYDQFIESEVLLPKNGVEMSTANVISRVKDKDVKVKGKYHKNPILDTRVQDVIFPDGVISQYATNVIAKAIYLQVDSNGHYTLLLKEITKHTKSASAVAIDDKLIISKPGCKGLRKNTKGWDL